jgi:hypothetical protein
MDIAPPPDVDQQLVDSTERLVVIPHDSNEFELTIVLDESIIPSLATNVKRIVLNW